MEIIGEAIDRQPLYSPASPPGLHGMAVEHARVCGLASSLFSFPSSAGITSLHQGLPPWSNRQALPHRGGPWLQAPGLNNQLFARGCHAILGLGDGPIGVSSTIQDLGCAHCPGQLVQTRCRILLRCRALGGA